MWRYRKVRGSCLKRHHLGEAFVQPTGVLPVRYGGQNQESS